MKKTIIFILVLTFLLSGNVAYAEDNVFNLGAFPLGISRTTLHYMMDNLPVSSGPVIFVGEIPWSTGVSKYNSETYTLPLHKDQIFKYKDTNLDIKTAGESFSLICCYDSNDQIYSVGIACDLDAKYLEKMEVKSLFFDNYKSLGLRGDPSVKGRLEDKYYSASENIDGVLVTMSVSVLKFNLSFGLA